MYNASRELNSEDGQMKTAEDIRRALQARYPDVEEDESAIELSGFIHENPFTAIGVVLISAALLGTTDVDRLAAFTRYSRAFIRAIAWNMENSGLWKDGKYNCSDWSASGNLLPRNEHEDHEFWDHISIGEGSMWNKDANSHDSVDSCKIFWDTKRVN